MTAPPKRIAQLIAACVLALVIVVPVALAAKGKPNRMKDTSPRATYEGMQTLHYKFGPVEIKPGQNTIEIAGIPPSLKPPGPGYITAFRPNLTYTDGSIPPVDVLHLHHGVWVVDFEPRWAVGEEKTNVDLPAGFGWRFEPEQRWLLNPMIHNLIPNPTEVYITWDIDFVPDSSPAAAGIKPVRTQWLDVSGVRPYPVFDALRHYGGRDRYTFPNHARGAQKAAIGPAHEWTVPHDLTLVWSAGHLHPGGLYTDLEVTRGGRKVRLFRSLAKYYEPAGAVSWDVTMTRTPDDWRVQLKKGDVVNVSGTYDVSRASWYESMAIMPSAVYDGTDAGGVDPFVTLPPQKGVFTHGHLPENDYHGGEDSGLPDARRMLGSGGGSTVKIRDFVFQRGDLTGRRVPTVKRGRSLTFVNKDDNGADLDIFHTITSCKAPCTGTTGIAFPLADGSPRFDSGELGTGPPGFTAASNRLSWKTPKSLRPGTYTYFCRIHPFMRGAFRVKR